MADGLSVPRDVVSRDCLPVWPCSRYCCGLRIPCKCSVVLCSLLAANDTFFCSVWGIADGARKASVDTEIMIYTVLDFLAKPVFGFWLLLSHRAMPETNIDLGGYWSHGLATEGRIRIGEED